MAGIQRNSYYYQNHRQSEALIRARRPYLVKNAITGLGIAAFAAAVYVYTIKAVGQDEFEDVKVPDSSLPQTKAAKN